MPSSNRPDSRQRMSSENFQYPQSPGLEIRPGSFYSKSQSLFHDETTLTTAYFLDRIDVENYSNQTLMNFVDSTLSKNKSKGLKVKLSLPDDGLVIDNVREPDQSWIFKKSELLYLWNDPKNSTMIVVITKNRTRRHSPFPFSASLFRLKSSSSLENFLQTAQTFFGQISDTFKSSEFSTNSDTIRSLNGKTKSRHRLSIHDPTAGTGSLRIRRESSRNSTPIRLITRTEFDPGKTLNESVIDSQENRTLSNEQFDEQNENKTILSSNFSPENILQLLTELKQLRNEIAMLKIEKSNKTTNTSPTISKQIVETKNKESATSIDDDILTNDSDAQTQTDFSFISHRRRRVSKRNKKTMVGSGVFLNGSNRKNPSTLERNKRQPLSASSTTTASDQEDTIQESSSQITDSSIDTSTQQTTEQIQTLITQLPPRPTLIKTSVVNLPMPSFMSNIERDESSNESQNITSLVPVVIEKEVSQYLPTDYVDNRSVHSKEHIYENVPTMMETVEPTLSISPPSKETNNTTVLPLEILPTQRPQIVSMGRHRSQPVYFANHLTNPMFTADKQLLVNTIANQFGVDLNSPQLQNLVYNQHLFVARKRTFANMVWQMTADEETALRSTSNEPNSIDLIDERPKSTSSILKSNKMLNVTSKGRSISWATSLE